MRHSWTCRLNWTTSLVRPVQAEESGLTWYTRFSHTPAFIKSCPSTSISPELPKYRQLRNNLAYKKDSAFPPFFWKASVFQIGLNRDLLGRRRIAPDLITCKGQRQASSKLIVSLGLRVLRILVVRNLG